MPASRFIHLSLLAALCSSNFLLAAEIQSRLVLQNSLPMHNRRPASMCWIADGQKLAIANERAQSITLLDPFSEKVLEASIDATPVDLAWLKSREQLAIVDSKSDRVLFVSILPEQLIVQQKVKVGRGARRLCLSPDEKFLAATAAWDRRVSLISLGTDIEIEQTIDLEFEPNIVCFSPDGSLLIVADAFGGELVVLETRTRQVVGRATLHAHQIRGIAFHSEDVFLLSHQILHADEPTTSNNIASGRVLENVVQEFQLNRTSPLTVEIQSLGFQEIGVPSHGAADPGSLQITKNAERFVALSGVGEVAVLNSYGVVRSRIDVGERPTDLLLSPDQQQLFCLNTLSDAVSVIDVETRLVERTFSLGPQPRQRSRDRGEKLFFDGHVSRFGWYSCQSCHVDGHTNSQLADTFGDGNAGAPKRIPSLLGGRDNNPWAWNGTMRSLHDQVLQSGKSTMRGGGFSARQANDLVAFLHTLEPPPASHPPANELDVRLVEQGRKVFERQGCANCHVPPLTYTSDSTYDVGLEDEHGLRKFNPPSLKAVGFRRSFFHDSRAKSLSEVFRDHGHQLDQELSDQELKALIRFLKSL